MTRVRFRMRTLLIVTAAVVLVAGGTRWWYRSQLAMAQQQLELTDRLREKEVSIVWGYIGPRTFEPWRWVPRPLFWSPTHVYTDHAADDVLAKEAPAFSELQMRTLCILARQLVPHVQGHESGKASPLIIALRQHPTLKRLVIDASIRGTPAGFDSPIYTRDDLTAIEAALPNVQVDWVEAN